jgi:hypothetical protein
VITVPNLEGGARFRPLRWLALALPVALLASRWLKSWAVKPVEVVEAETTGRPPAKRSRATEPRAAKQKRKPKPKPKRTTHTSPPRH